MTKESPWIEEINYIKGLVEKTELTHHIKWGIDVYAYETWNLIGIAPFKHFLGIWFYDGVFMEDPNGKFVNAQEGKTKALRQWRFTSLEEIKNSKLESYMQEAIQNAKSGKHWIPEKTTKIELPIILDNALKTDNSLQTAFEALSLSKRKEFAGYIHEAKREQTKLDRLKKIKPLILSGKGLYDKYFG